MPYQALGLWRRDSIAFVQLRRPQVGNAIDGALILELAAAAQELALDPRVRAVVLGAEGETFSRGWSPEFLAPESFEPLSEPGALDRSFQGWAALPRPVVAALHGDALSGGLELALACDLRVAAEDARFGLPEVNYGFLPMGGGTQRLPRLVGRSMALAMILDGAIIDAAEALRIGLVNRVVPRKEVAAAAEEMARRIANGGPIALRYAKEAVHRGLEMTLEQGLRYETDLTVILQTTEDRAEGVRAFLEKRQPVFKGR